MKKLLLVICSSLLFLQTAHADKIAIIGGGASGLVSAWLLEQRHDVTIYEANDCLGGHANTIEVKTDQDSTPIAIDAGAEFFNEPHYPHFFKLLKHFNIPLKSFTLVTTLYRTDKSDVIILPPYHDKKVEWKSLTPVNLDRSIKFKIVVDNGLALIKKHDTTTNLQTFIDSLCWLTPAFKADIFYPLAAAAWGISPNEAPDLAAYNALRYIVDNYNIKNYTWYEVTGGLKVYIDAVANSLQSTQVKLNARVSTISKNNGRYVITASDGSQAEYDQLIFATDASVASQILGTLADTAALSQALGKVNYYDTKIAIHGDVRFMPPNKNDWRVVNIRYNGKYSAITFYKAWKSKAPIFKSWLTYDVRSPKDAGPALPSPLYSLLTYRHPKTDRAYFEAQKTIVENQGKQNIWFAGMWTTDNDSHESAISSAVSVAKQLAPGTDRLKVLEGK
ncbi:MAG: FAD-dependent oxidoreductase [Gammaproteobacteria bacterium]